MPDRPARRRPKDDRRDKVAPWRKWKSVTLSAASGGAYPYRVHFTVSGLDDEKNTRYSNLITAAAHKYFKIEEPPSEKAGPAAYLVTALPAGKRKGKREAKHKRKRRGPVQLLRVVYDELIVQFKPSASSGRRIAILEETGFRVVEPSSRVKDQWIVRHSRGKAGESLLKAADKFAGYNEVEFAWPKSVAEYVRATGQTFLPHDWWLPQIGINPSNLNVLTGDASVVIAVLDDGVDIVHPNLAAQVAAGFGKDFVFLPGETGHWDPRPKVQVDDGEDSDYHGTLCAGIICSNGGPQAGFRGVAPNCKLIAVRVFDGANLIDETRLANAITYATDHADVISCSWGGLKHPVVEKAIDDTALGRDGKGSVFVASAGNEYALSIAFPACHSPAIAVGACGPAFEVTPYSNRGNELAVVAPSSRNNTTVYSADVSQPDWGYNPGDPLDPQDPTGLYWDWFGGTSAAAAMTAGVAALCLSVNPDLKATEVRDVLQDTAIKVGTPPKVVYDAQGHSPKFGYGCIHAAAAVAEALKRLPS